MEGTERDGSAEAQDAGGDAGAERDAGPISVAQALTVEPQDAQLVLGGDNLPTLTFTATPVPEGSSAAAIRWTSDRPELGRIDPNTGMFTPSGAAGQVKVTASAGSLSPRPR